MSDTPKAGHNSTNAQLRSIVERIERLNGQRKELGDDIRDVFAEAKSNGYDVKVLRQVLRLRQQDRDERAEQEMLRDTYMSALGE